VPKAGFPLRAAASPTFAIRHHDLQVLTNMQKYFNMLIILALFIPFNTMIVLRQYYTWTKPSSAQSETGNIVPVRVDYGRTVYVTSTEATWLHFVYALTAICLGTFYVYVVVKVAKEKGILAIFRS
jgi:hypothetical protein